MSLAGAVALGTGAAAVGLWNQSRYDGWERTQRAIYKDAVMPGVTELTLVARQNANDEALRSVRRFDRVTLGLGAAAGVAVVAALALLLLP